MSATIKNSDLSLRTLKQERINSTVRWRPTGWKEATKILVWLKLFLTTFWLVT